MTATLDDCQHEHFEANVNVFRHTEVDGGPVTSFSAEITVRCKQCLTQFKFLGLGVGMLPTQPTTDVDGTELRAPIVPVGREDMIAKVGFTIQPRMPQPMPGLSS